jgi:hypothetical protein
LDAVDFFVEGFEVFARGADARELALVLEREEPAALVAAGFFTVFFAVPAAGFRTDFTLLLRWVIDDHLGEQSSCERLLDELQACGRLSCEPCSFAEPCARPSWQLAFASLWSFVLLAFAWLQSYARPSWRLAFALPWSCELLAFERLACAWQQSFARPSWQLAFASLSSFVLLAFAQLSFARPSWQLAFASLSSFVRSSSELQAYERSSFERSSSLQLPFEQLA